MSITILSKISMCPDDLVLLDKMAAAAGKSRDAFISDWVASMVEIEKALLNGDGPREHAYTR